MVTKCPNDLGDAEKQTIIKQIAPKEHQHVFFSHIAYSDKAVSASEEMPLEAMGNFTLVTGIANAQPLVRHLKSKSLDFEHLEYGDHYNFTIKDIELLEQKDLIITTEKDYMRLLAVESLQDKLFYIAIETVIDKYSEFNKLILDFVN